jgi:hypothetical protein
LDRGFGYDGIEKVDLLNMDISFLWMISSSLGEKRIDPLFPEVHAGIGLRRLNAV